MDYIIIKGLTLTLIYKSKENIKNTFWPKNKDSSYKFRQMTRIEVQIDKIAIFWKLSKNSF